MKIKRRLENGEKKKKKCYRLGYGDNVGWKFSFNLRYEVFEKNMEKLFIINTNRI
jgi:hypothetical protein